MHQVSVGYPTMHKALVFLYVYNSTLWVYHVLGVKLEKLDNV